MRVGFDLPDFPAFPIVDGHSGVDEYVAFGGDLTLEWIIEAYTHGFFPFYAFREEELSWSCPVDRFVIFPDEIHVSHSMRNLINKGTYSVTFDTAFDDVIGNCSELRIDEKYAWLGPDIVKSYRELHRQGVAHSVEVWKDGRLVGGLYGLLIDDVFFGESMFSLEPSASKLALIHLARRLKSGGVKFIDCQYETPHLLSMGGRHISYGEYMQALGWEDPEDWEFPEMETEK